MSRRKPYADGPPLWHVLQISDVLDLEFATALTQSVPVLAWEPQRSLFPASVRHGQEVERLANLSPGLASADDTGSPLRVRRLPLLRGFARPPFSYVARTGPSVVSRLLRQTPRPETSPLICTVPFFASVAERWPGPVVYWLTDLIAEYSSADRDEVLRLDRRLCKRATLLCPNSKRLQAYMVEQAGADPEKIEIVPNATRASNLLPQAPEAPAHKPSILGDIQRPIAGIIGNLAGNMDWLLLEQLVTGTPWLSWVFVGPTSMNMADPKARLARDKVIGMQNTLFVGRQPYGSLAGFARTFDVAVLPYLRCEPTFSGSSTRFYEHLAACRPMIATRGLEELSRKTPLLTLFDTAEEGLQALETLRMQNFNDGLQHARWQASQQGTWHFRAQTVQQALAARVGHSSLAARANSTQEAEALPSSL